MCLLRVSQLAFILFLSIHLVACSPIINRLSEKIQEREYQELIDEGNEWIEDNQDDPEKSLEIRKVRRLIARARLEIARESPGVAQLQKFQARYRATYPARFADLIKRAWHIEASRVFKKKIIPAVSVKLHQEFRARYPNSRHEKDSKDREFKIAWEDARKQDLLHSYQGFKSTYQTWEQFNTILPEYTQKEATRWYLEKTQPAKSVLAHRLFQKLYPQAIELADSRQQLVEYAYRDAQSKDTIASYRDYRRVYKSWPEAQTQLAQSYQRLGELTLEQIITQQDIDKIDQFKSLFPEDNWQEQAEKARVRIALFPLQATIGQPADIDPSLAMTFIKTYHNHPFLTQEARPIQDSLYQEVKRGGYVWKSRLFRTLFPQHPESQTLMNQEAELLWPTVKSSTEMSQVRDFILWYPHHTQVTYLDTQIEFWKERSDAKRRWPQAEIHRTFVKSNKLDLIVNVKDCTTQGPQYVSGVPRDMFTLLSGNERLKPLKFKGIEDDRPVDISFNLDLSGSMDTERKAVHYAVSDFVNRLSFRQRDSRIGLVAYTNKVHFKGRPTRSPKKFQSWIDKLDLRQRGAEEDTVNAIFQSLSSMRSGTNVEQVPIIITDEPLQMTQAGLKKLKKGLPRVCKFPKCLQRCKKSQVKCFLKCQGYLPRNQRVLYHQCVKDLKKRYYGRLNIEYRRRSCLNALDHSQLRQNMNKCSGGQIDKYSPELAKLAKVILKKRSRPFFLIPNADSSEMQTFQSLSQATQGQIFEVPENSTSAEPYVKQLKKMSEMLSTQYYLQYRWKDSGDPSQLTQFVIQRNYTWTQVAPLPNPTQPQVLLSSLSQACPTLFMISADHKVHYRRCGGQWTVTKQLTASYKYSLRVGQDFLILDGDGTLLIFKSTTGDTFTHQTPAPVYQMQRVNGSVYILTRSPKIDSSKSTSNAMALFMIESELLNSSRGVEVGQWKKLDLPTQLSSKPHLFKVATSINDQVCLQEKGSAWCHHNQKWNQTSSSGLPDNAISADVSMYSLDHRPEVTLMIGSDQQAYRTTNRGRTWSKVSLEPSKANTKHKTTADFTSVINIPGQRPMTCLVAQKEIWCSEDSGLHWFRVSDHEQEIPPYALSNVGRQAFMLGSDGVHRLDRIVNRDIPSSAVYFKTDDDQPLPELRPFLLTIADLMNRDLNLSLRIEGHADYRGSKQHNYDLALRRAKAVAEVIKQRGISEQRLTVKSYGESKPLTRGSNARALAKNRRVELIMSTPMNQNEEDKAWSLCPNQN